MAPHALIDLHDSSDYYPSETFDALFQARAAQQCFTSSITDYANPGKAFSTKKLQILGRQDPNVWRLSSEEIEDVEEGMRYFSGIYYPSPARNVTRNPCRLGFSTQPNQPDNLSFERGSKVKIERRSQKYLWRTEIPCHFRTRFLSAQRLRECDLTHRYCKPYW